jgi:hypothetical protein
VSNPEEPEKIHYDPPRGFTLPVSLFANALRMITDGEIKFEVAAAMDINEGISVPCGLSACGTSCLGETEIGSSIGTVITPIDSLRRPSDEEALNS